MNLLLMAISLITFIVTVIVVPLRLSKILKKLDVVTKNQRIIEDKIKNK